MSAIQEAFLLLITFTSSQIIILWMLAGMIGWSANGMSAFFIRRVLALLILLICEIPYTVADSTKEQASHHW